MTMLSTIKEQMKNQIAVQCNKLEEIQKANEEKFKGKYLMEKTLLQMIKT